MMNLRSNFLPKMWWMFWGRNIQNTSQNLHVNRPFIFIWPFWRAFTTNPKSLHQHKLGYHQFLMWILWTYNLIFSRSQWCPMLNGLWTNPWISIQCPNIGRKFLPMNCYMVFWIHDNDRSCYGSNYRICGREKKNFKLDIHQNKIVKSTLWTYGCDGV
jgi:hypothetical protein